MTNGKVTLLCTRIFLSKVIGINMISSMHINSWSKVLHYLLEMDKPGATPKYADVGAKVTTFVAAHYYVTTCDKSCDTKV